MKIVEKIKSVSQDSNFTFAIVFAFCIFAQCILTNYSMFHQLAITSLWKTPITFFQFYAPSISIALFLSSFVFLFKRNWWTIVLLLIFDVWILSNLWYYRANDLVINKFVIQMADNINGFTDSVLALIKPLDFLFLLLTIAMIVIYIYKKKNKNYHLNIKLFSIFIVLSLIIGLLDGIFLSIDKKENSMILIANKTNYTFLNPFKPYKYHTFENLDNIYVHEHTICHYFFYTIKDILTKEDPVIITEEEKNRINSFINTSKQKTSTKNPLILCIVESLNSFVITQDFMPNVFNFIQQNPNILYAHNVKTQIKGGMSGDGQMIIQTGLLPINKGAACMRFPSSKYPSLSHNYKTVGVFPTSLRTWNQYYASKAYNIDTNIVLAETTLEYSKFPSDNQLLSKATELTQTFDNVMVLTMATHTPCTEYADSSDLVLPDTISNLMKNYIKSANVTDKAIKILLDQITQNEKLKNSTILITGDHNLPISDDIMGKAYNYSRMIPLIIYSPEIKEKTIITDTVYQMDIYPTLLHLIGCEDYWWKGFGVNLLDSNARYNRPIMPKEAYYLSDKIITSDYFSNFDYE